jgi:hypothetical protein
MPGFVHGSRRIVSSISICFHSSYWTRPDPRPRDFIDRNGLDLRSCFRIHEANRLAMPAVLPPHASVMNSTAYPAGSHQHVFIAPRAFGRLE